MWKWPERSNYPIALGPQTPTSLPKLQPTSVAIGCNQTARRIDHGILLDCRSNEIGGTRRTGLFCGSGSTFADALAIEVLPDCLLDDRGCALVAFERQPLHFFDQSRIHVNEELPPAGERRSRPLLIPRHRKELHPSAIPTSSHTPAGPTSSFPRLNDANRSFRAILLSCQPAAFKGLLVRY